MKEIADALGKLLFRLLVNLGALVLSELMIWVFSWDEL